MPPTCSPPAGCCEKLRDSMKLLDNILLVADWYNKDVILGVTEIKDDALAIKTTLKALYAHANCQPRLP